MAATSGGADAGVEIPILLFGVELIVDGCLLAGAFIARGVLRQLWTIGARVADDPDSVVHRRVVG